MFLLEFKQFIHSFLIIKSFYYYYYNHTALNLFSYLPILPFLESPPSSTCPLGPACCTNYMSMCSNCGYYSFRPSYTSNPLASGGSQCVSYCPPNYQSINAGSKYYCSFCIRKWHSSVISTPLRLLSLSLSLSLSLPSLFFFFFSFSFFFFQMYSSEQTA